MSRHGCRTPSSAQMRRAILTAPAERDDMLLLLLLLLLLLAQRELDAAAFAWTDAGGATDAAAAASAGMGARGSAGAGRPAARFSALAACMRVLSTSSG